MIACIACVQISSMRCKSTHVAVLWHWISLRLICVCLFVCLFVCVLASWYGPSGACLCHKLQHLNMDARYLTLFNMWARPRITVNPTWIVSSNTGEVYGQIIAQYVTLRRCAWGVYRLLVEFCGNHQLYKLFWKQTSRVMMSIPFWKILA